MIRRVGFTAGLALVLMAVGAVTADGLFVLGVLLLAAGMCSRHLRMLVPLALAAMGAGVWWHLDPPELPVVPLLIGGGLVALIAAGSLGVVRTARGGRHGGFSLRSVRARDARAVRGGRPPRSLRVGRYARRRPVPPAAWTPPPPPPFPPAPPPPPTWPPPPPPWRGWPPISR
jgi:hypothetical protein